MFSLIFGVALVFLVIILENGNIKNYRIIKDWRGFTVQNKHFIFRIWQDYVGGFKSLEEAEMWVEDYKKRLEKPVEVFPTSQVDKQP